MHTNIALVDHRCGLLVFEDLGWSLENVFFAFMRGMFKSRGRKHLFQLLLRNGWR